MALNRRASAAAPAADCGPAVRPFWPTKVEALRRPRVKPKGQALLPQSPRWEKGRTRPGTPASLEEFVSGHLARAIARHAVGVEPDVLHGLHHVAAGAVDAPARLVRRSGRARGEGQALTEFLLGCRREHLRIDVDRGDLHPRRLVGAHLDLQIAAQMVVVVSPGARAGRRGLCPATPPGAAAT